MYQQFWACCAGREQKRPSHQPSGLASQQFWVCWPVYRQVGACQPAERREGLDAGLSHQWSHRIQSARDRRIPNLSFPLAFAFARLDGPGLDLPCFVKKGFTSTNRFLHVSEFASQQLARLLSITSDYC